MPYSSQSYNFINYQPMKPSLLFLGVLFSWMLLSCGKSEEQAYIPRPKGYNQINLPKANYRPLAGNYPYTFEVSRFAKVLPDTVSWAEPHWIYIYYPQWKAFIQITYKDLKNPYNKLNLLIDDAYKLAYKHQGRASHIQDYVLTTRSGKKAGLFELEGEVATSLQFYTTDSTKHYLRGAVYVRTATDNDSLAPIIAFIKKDAMHLIQTLRWK